MKRTHITAIGIALAIGLWLLSGQYGDDENVTAARANTDAASAGGMSVELNNTSARVANSVPVRGRVFTARPHATESVVRGRTQANRMVELRSQAKGYVQALPHAKGSRVSGGETVCRLAVDARAANLDEARAMQRSRQLEYDAAVDLASKGHRSETQTAAARASLDAARAMVKRAEIAISHTSVKAPFDGLIEALPVEIGDYMGEGAICAHIVDDDPMLITGQISERDIGNFRVGDSGVVRLVTGEEAIGTIRFIGTSADPETRTFRLELETANPDHVLRDGITAEIRVLADPVEAHLISPALITLNDEGVVGIRIVDAKSVARFVPIRIVANSPEGVWITGPPDRTTIITVGHEYVTDGVPVQVELENMRSAGGPS